jgi:creatinine amidohydrolase
MRLKRMRFPDLSGDKKYNFIVPIGSLEQHGPFAPFGTDTYITDYLVDQVEKQFPELLILPTLEFSRAQEHRGFFGTVYLSEETFAKVMFDICNSIFQKADHIFITSFHHNHPYIQKFIQENSDFFKPAKLVHLEICHDEDDKILETILGGPIDGHAGNTEISNMMVIDESTVVQPHTNDKKTFIENAFATDNLFEKSPNGIADNHPNWIINKEIGQKSLDLYTGRMIKNLKTYLK